MNAPYTRRSFLERIFNPLLSANQDKPYTLAEAIREVSIGADKLHKFGTRPSVPFIAECSCCLDIFHEPIELTIDRPSRTDPSTTPTDIDVYLSVREKSRLLLKTGTDVGNAEGSAYANVLLRNVFGGAEKVNLNASLGTRTRSAYQISFETPFLSNPNFRGEIGALSSSTQKEWSSHEEALKGAWAKLRWISGGSRHELAYNSLWRQITGLASNASPTVRGDAGDSVKSSISHTWTKDRRDNSILPSRGYYSKTYVELAGWGPLKGDVAFCKSEIEAQGAVPIPLPGTKGKSGVSFTSSVRAGLLYPLPLGLDEKPPPSRLNDRFQLGGPTDIRGFRLSGLGPRDGADAVGGDVYAAGSANLLVPIPGMGADRPFRLQAFINGGRLLALKQPTAIPGHGIDAPPAGPAAAASVRQSVYSSLAELGNGLPSTSAGFGLIYAHPVARFELNFSLPLVLRRGEEGRKGVQFGIGINLL